MDQLITEVDHWVAFGLLAAVGGKMLWEARHGVEEQPGITLGWHELLVLSFATSIDALAVRISLAFLPVSILPAVLLGDHGGCLTRRCPPRLSRRCPLAAPSRARRRSHPHPDRATRPP